MKLYRVRAVVLNSRQMRDAHRLLTLFSREKGKIKVVAHGAAKPTSRKRGAVQPFCHSELLLRRGRELDSVEQCEGLEIFPGLWEDLDRMSYAGHVVELVDGLTADGEPNQAVFELLLHTLKAMEGTADLELVARGFELRLLSLLGYQPYLDGCVNCGSGAINPVARFSPEAGGLVCPGCFSGTRGVPCGGETVSVMKLLPGWDPFKIDRLRVSQQARGEMKVIMREYLQWHMEGRPRSLQFMEQVQI
ncbi:DNA repair protein RecO [Desulfallas sp. Bu1-1]|jgi:DNA repair protein RecO (recombination protein O)|uniref:DNA repair protein RecO n=1 Tax=Desulfallas sp. Bu1-1 TaxID=2787620 RepID=UPI00189FF829|nr:DNA repair protein RecO [Desulfallas sp. Bu1-1]MBF7082631.1 DNA repair protein RecO [Desulfallas sp. Bu1-1]